MIDFIWRNIICQFGVPKKIVCDNGSQFIGAKVTKSCDEWKIKRITSSPYHPVANSHAKSSNKTLIETLKMHLDKPKGRWLEELLDGHIEQ